MAKKEKLASRALKDVKSVNRCRRLRDIVQESENQLSKSYFKRKILAENKAIEKMTKNPKHFYTYVKSKNKES